MALTAFGQTTFPGTGTGAIPDNSATCATVEGSPLNVTFTVTGIAGAPSNVSVSFTGTHTWVGDVNARLIAPNGTTFILEIPYTPDHG